MKNSAQQGHSDATNQEMEQGRKQLNTSSDGKLNSNIIQMSPSVRIGKPSMS